MCKIDVQQIVSSTLGIIFGFCSAGRVPIVGPRRLKYACSGTDDVNVPECLFGRFGNIFEVVPRTDFGPVKENLIGRLLVSLDKLFGLGA